MTTNESIQFHANTSPLMKQLVEIEAACRIQADLASNDCAAANYNVAACNIRTAGYRIERAKNPEEARQIAESTLTLATLVLGKAAMRPDASEVAKTLPMRLAVALSPT